MEKTAVVASLGHRRLMLPAWVRAALCANDRLEVYLTVLQAASVHASQPKHELPDLTTDMATAGLRGGWLYGIAPRCREPRTRSALSARGPAVPSLSPKPTGRRDSGDRMATMRPGS